MPSSIHFYDTSCCPGPGEFSSGVVKPKAKKKKNKNVKTEKFLENQNPKKFNDFYFGFLIDFID